MNDHQESLDRLISQLKERAKELNCLYAVEELVSQPDARLEDVCRGIMEAIPPGWQFPDICQAKIVIDGDVFTSPNFEESIWSLSAEVMARDTKVGTVSVYYTKQMPEADVGPFLKEESRLIRTIADRLGHFVGHIRMRRMVDDYELVRRELSESKQGDWRIILELLSQTDKSLFMKISHKMLIHLCWSGITKAVSLMEKSDLYRQSDDQLIGESNRPHERRAYEFPKELGMETFRIASDHLSDQDILQRIQKWMHEDKLGFLVRAVERNLALPDLADAIRRYQHLAAKDIELSQPNRAGVRVSLIRRFLSDQLAYIGIAKEYMGIRDFNDLLERMIFSNDSLGRLGGKSAGLYLAARILETEAEKKPELKGIRLPRTWHITSDMQLHFMHYNNLDEVVEQKYKEIAQVRFEYPHIVHTCKNSRFTPEMVKGLSMALDDLGETPLIVRSSSVLEDRIGAAFSGKYKSLFLANQGSKLDRLEALMDAIAEVYASMFGPDPIEYRAERGLLDFAEEMGIMIQEVVGRRVGPYFLPLYAGVGFSRNEFRWSARIQREDGLTRLVPGLGTRAVDRVVDDYTVMFAPGQPGLRVNVTIDEAVRYAPHLMDVINLEKNTFETIEASKFYTEYADDLPGGQQLISIYKNGDLRSPSITDTNLAPKDVVVTFRGLLDNKSFGDQMHSILRVLEERLQTPVDIEFAHDGEHFYLLQCRPQSYSEVSSPAPIPKDVPPQKIVFTANRFVSNGEVPDITHVVYVDPDRYAELRERDDLLKVGRAVSRLNKLLPKRQFILMGPGRWGSRGDIKLGVNVTYSDINNTAMLIEIARTKDNYTPELSFGTHFFQDLVEARIRYLPLYPDDPGVSFNDRFLLRSLSILKDIAPEFSELDDVIRVIDISRVSDGEVLQVLLNADLDEAVGILAEPTQESRAVSQAAGRPAPPAAIHWRWRLSMAEAIAAQIAPQDTGIKAMYVFGSTKNGTAGPGSDIDLLVHFEGGDAQRKTLQNWFEGWSLSLAVVNYQRTGYKSDGLLDVHYITDKDIENKTSYASKINAVSDAARPLRLGKDESNGDRAGAS